MPQIEWNGDGFYYLIRWRAVNSDSEDFEVLRIPFPDAYQQVIPGEVQSYQEYIISVKAGNSFGESDAQAQEVRGFSGENSE